MATRIRAAHRARQAPSKSSESAAPRFGHPRPQLRRDSYVSLDGRWEFALDERGDRWSNPGQVSFGGTITVPFAPETPASGVHHTGFIHACWYRRTFDVPELQDGRRLILHFGAVDFAATVWVNGSVAVRHEGGYTPFSADITELVRGGEPATVVVGVTDDPLDMHKPRGKQDWLPEPHSIWYYRTTGIWQTVWLEVVPATRIGSVRWTADVAQWQVALDARIDGARLPGAKLRVRLTARGSTLADETYEVTGAGIGPQPAEPVVQRTIRLIDPGIGDGREFLFWWPHRPTLIDAELTLSDADGNVIDAVASYTAMRSVTLQGDRFVMNGSPFNLQMVLNQGYWPETGLTAPDDDAYRRDVELLKEMGFNGVRMHQKIENPRFLYWADTLGLCVWGEMPSAYSYSATTVRRVSREWVEAIERDFSHPCIVAWVPVNESWGVPDLPLVAAQRHFQQTLYHLAKSIDPTRPVIGNDGWEMVETDIVAIHDYDKSPEVIRRRYANTPDARDYLFSRERPGGRALILGDLIDPERKPIMLTEFGGIAYSKDRNGSWGYSRAESSAALAQQYYELLSAVRGLPMFSGFCYTQFTDTYQEANGLLYMDRKPKFPIAEIAVATRGARTEQEQKIEAAWRRKAGK